MRVVLAVEVGLPTHRKRERDHEEYGRDPRQSAPPTRRRMEQHAPEHDALRKRGEVQQVMLEIERGQAPAEPRQIHPEHHGGTDPQ